MKPIFAALCLLASCLLTQTSGNYLGKHPEDYAHKFNPLYTQTEPSFIVALKVDVLDDAKDAYLAYAVGIVNSLQIPDVSFSGGYIKGIKVHAEQNPDHMDFYLEEKHNAFCMSMEKLSAFFEIEKVYYKVAGIKIKGKVKMVIDKGFSFKACYQMSSQFVDGKQLPAINVIESKVDLDPNRSKLEIKGNTIAKLGNAIKNILGKQLQISLSKELAQLLATEVPSAFNEFIEGTDGIVAMSFMEATEDIVLNIEIPHPFVVDKEKIVIAINGTSYDKDGFIVQPDVPSAKVENITMKGNNSAQVYMNTYFLNSAVHSFFTGTTLQPKVLSMNIPKKQNAKIQEMIYKYFPGVWVYFLGGDFNIHFDLWLAGCESVQIQENGFLNAGNASAITGLTMYQGKDALKLKFKVTQSDVNMTLDFFNTQVLQKNRMGLSLNEIDVNNVIVLNSFFGDFESLFYTEFVSLIFYFVLDQMNSQIAKKPVAIPSNIADVMKIDSIRVGYYDNYIEGGMGISFYKPEPGEKLLLQDVINEAPVKFKKAAFPKKEL